MPAYTPAKRSTHRVRLPWISLSMLNVSAFYILFIWFDFIFWFGWLILLFARVKMEQQSNRCRRMWLLIQVMMQHCGAASKAIRWMKVMCDGSAWAMTWATRQKSISLMAPPICTSKMHDARMLEISVALLTIAWQIQRVEMCCSSLNVSIWSFLSFPFNATK